MNRQHQFRPIELAMRVVLFVKERAKGDAFLLPELVEQTCHRFAVSRATGYRLARLSLDVLCIEYGPNEARNARFAERRERLSVGGRIKQHHGLNGSSSHA